MKKTETTLGWLTTEIKNALKTFRNGNLPSPIKIDESRRIEFAFEYADDDEIGGELLRNKRGGGLQIHEYLNDEPFSYTDDEDEKLGGWLVWKEDTPKSIATQICGDFDIN